MLPHVHVPSHDASASSAAAATAAAASPDASASAPAAPAAAVASAAAPLSFSFTSTARRAAPAVTAALGSAARASAAAASNAQPERQVISGALTAGSLAASHRRAEQQATSGGLGAKGLVIPLIKQTQWRGAGAAAGGAAAAASSSAAAALPASHPSMLSTAGVAALKARDAAGSSSGAGIAFESEQDLIDEAYAEKQAARAAAAAAAAAASPSDDMPALQTIAETAAPMSLDEEAAAALLNDATAMPRGSAPVMPSMEQQEAFARAAPILIANALPGNNKMLSEEERLALDVDLRPDEASLEDYNRVPISEFGAGMLRGMGWAGLGDPIGGINKSVCEPVQFAARGERMGLGATFAKVKDKDNRGGKRILKPGETRDAVGVVRVGPTASSASAAGPTAAELKAKSLRSLGSRLIQVHSQQLRVGALVEVMDGAHRKSYGKIVSFSDPSGAAHVDDVSLTVRLNLTGQVVDVLRGQVEILDERAMPDDHPAFETAEGRAKRLERESKELAARGAQQRDERKEDAAGSKRERSSRSEREDEESSKKHRSDRDRSRDRDRSSSKRSRSRERRDHHHSSSSSSRHASSSAHSSSSSSSSSAAAASSGPPRWVRAHIRVRIVSSSFAGGKYYNCKGTVVDVSSSSHILVRPDGGGKIIEGLAERQLESVIPPAGQVRVMILRGEHRGAVGKLIQKQTDKARAVVQMDEDLNILTVDFDDISEFVG